MPGLSAKQLPPEVLRAGDLIEYYTRRFVAGDPRGHRVAVVQAIDDRPETPFPVKLDIKEPLPRDNLLRRHRDSSETAQNQCRDATSKKKPSRSSETASNPRPTTEATHDSSEEPCVSEEMVEPPTDTALIAAQAYASTVPTRWMRKKIRHQAKETACTWEQYRSRKHRY
eukprot:jgi/Phyca11/80767/gw1.7.964.1